MVIHVDRKDSSIARIVAATFPGYSGTKISIATEDSYRPENYWSGGSRTYAMAYNLETGKAMPLSEATANPMNGAAHTKVDIPANIAIVERVIFRGKDLGIRIIVRPETVTPFLPQSSELTERHLKILATIRSYISSYRKEVFSRNNVTQGEKDELTRLSYLTKQGGLTISGKNAAQNIEPW